MKQNEKRNKKGRVAKSALSVALATSMVVSSSTFVYASPVVEEVSPVDVQLEAPAVIDEATVTEENVGTTTYRFVKGTFDINGGEAYSLTSSNTETLGQEILSSVKTIKLKRKENGVEEQSPYDFSAFLDNKYYNVYVDKPANGIYGNTTALPTTPGKHTIYVVGTTDSTDPDYDTAGRTVGTYYVNAANEFADNQTFEMSPNAFTRTGSNASVQEKIWNSVKDVEIPVTVAGVTEERKFSDYCTDKKYDVIIENEVGKRVVLSQFTLDKIPTEIPYENGVYTITISGNNKVDNYNYATDSTATTTFTIGVTEYKFEKDSFDITDIIKVDEYGNPVIEIENEFIQDANDEETRNAIWTTLKDEKITLMIGDEKIVTTVADICKDAKHYDVTLHDAVTNLKVGDLTGVSEDAEATAKEPEKIPTDLGKYYVQIEGKQTELGGFYVNGTTTAVYSIVENVQDAVKFECKAPTYYTGQPQTPDFKLTVRGIELKKGTDYEIVSWADNTDSCSVADKAASVTVKYINKYSQRGQDKFYFAINRASMTKNATVTVAQDLVYNAKSQVPEVTVTYKHADNLTPVELVAGKDYTVEIVNSKDNSGKAIDVGTYDVVIHGINNYKNAAPNVSFKITKQQFNENTIKVTANSTYMGDPTAIVGGKYYRENIIVTDAVSGARLTEGVDYKVTYKKDDTGDSYVTSPVAEKAGTYGIKLEPAKLSNYYAGSVLAEYTVTDVKDNLQKYVDLNKNAGKIEYNPSSSLEYKTDGAIPTSVTINGVTYKADGTVENKDNITDPNAFRFDVKFPLKSECTSVGTYNIQLVGTGEWAGQTVELPFTVTPVDMTGKEEIIEVYKTSKGNVTAYIKVVDESQTEAYTLVSGTDFDYTINKNTSNDNKYDVSVAYKGNYKGVTPPQTVSVKPGKMSIGVDAIKAEVKGEYIYNGITQKPALEDIVLTYVDGDNTTVLRPGVDYELDSDDKDNVGHKAYGENINVGKGQVYLKGIGSKFGGERTVEFDIKAGEGLEESYVLDTSNLKAVYEYGTSFNPAADIKVKTKEGKVLTKDADYTVKYLRNGHYTDDFSGLGEVAMEITIKESKTTLKTSYRVATALHKVTTLPKEFADVAFTGSAVEPEVTLIKKDTVVKLVKDKDYTVTYSNNANAGEATVTIEGIGDYYGTYVYNFNITPVDLAADVALEKDTYTYTGEKIEPEVIVKDAAGNVVAAKEYAVVYENNTMPGTATVKVTGNGNFKFSAEKTFTIVKDTQELSIPKNQVSDLKARNTNANYYTLRVAGAKTDLSFSSSNTKVATIDKYGKISFKHVVGETTLTVTAAGTDGIEGATLKVAVKVIPATPTIKVAAANNAFKVTASKVKDAGGYQVAYATKADFSNQTKKAFHTTAKLSKTIKGKDKTTYNVKVRAYKKVNGKYVFGKWSKAQVVKTK